MTEFTQFDPSNIDSKWQRIWAEKEINKTPLEAARKPFYNLMMFPYPSAEKLHVGNAFAFCGADIYGRFRRLKGDDVFEPMGFDAFGIHSENYALIVGEHPKDLTEKNVTYFREEQLKKLGLMIDWSHEVNTTHPEYYKWTQWIFLKLFHAGLAEYRNGLVNWCPGCLTVLADEQVDNGICERCSNTVEKKYLKQWFIKTTQYAQELLDALPELDWSEKTKIAQSNWIGRSEGVLVDFDLSGCDTQSVTVFTTRPDTLYGATFLGVGADHPHLLDFTSPSKRSEVENWQHALPLNNTEPDFSLGINLGTYAIHPLTGAKIPVWAAPYVLGSYGTGVIMAVPAHDARDWQFAQEHNIPLIEVISGGDILQEAYVGDGTLINSDICNGLSSLDAKEKILEMLSIDQHGRFHVQYRLRDWLISRQRYWGPPIPIIHCPSCGPVAVKEEDLPVILPDIGDFRPLGTGISPLALLDDWVIVDCPHCGISARRETDVSDNFLDSAWYFLRYPSTNDNLNPFDHVLTWKWLPVNMYIGGNEHAVLHLLYARFIMRVLHKLGYVPVPEPFEHFRAHGLLIKDGAKISKSKGNIVNPDEYVKKYGADAFRLHLMFLGPFLDGGDWRDDGIKGVTRFLERVWRIIHCPLEDSNTRRNNLDLERRRHQLIFHVDKALTDLRYNSAIAFLMEFARELDKEGRQGSVRRIDAMTLTQLLAPLAPHVADELWEYLGNAESIHQSQWPEYSQELAKEKTVTIAVQINGKVRGSFDIAAGASQENIVAAATSLPRIQELMDGKTARNLIVIPDRIINIVL